ncbi:MAG: enoyl-CoA hydratase/isomerase family protein [Mycobacterium sp.]|nr:enoyl-CoA hydratase/isomerase family protein [Mycobacterium sp.]
MRHPVLVPEVTYTSLVYERRAAVAVVTINDPPRNRMSFAFMNELESLVDDIAADSGVRSVVITAAGDQNFSVGMNLKELAPVLDDRERVDKLLDQRLRVLAAIENMGKPWIATLFGNCLGGGLELPLACHFRLAAQDGAHIGLPELHLGSVPAWGGSARLVRAIGRDHAMNLILRAKSVSGPEALDLGLVTEVYPNAELKQRALDLAGELAALPATAMAAMLRCLVNSDDRALEESLRDERAAFHATLGSADMFEGMTAFLEKRRPKFNRPG